MEGRKLLTFFFPSFFLLDCASTTTFKPSHPLLQLLPPQSWATPRNRNGWRDEGPCPAAEFGNGSSPSSLGFFDEARGTDQCPGSLDLAWEERHKSQDKTAKPGRSEPWFRNMDDPFPGQQLVKLVIMDSTLLVQSQSPQSLYYCIEWIYGVCKQVYLRLLQPLQRCTSTSSLWLMGHLASKSNLHTT